MQEITHISIVDTHFFHYYCIIHRIAKIFAKLNLKKESNWGFEANMLYKKIITIQY